MYHGGVKINKRTAHIIRVTGLIVPLVLLGYGLLIHYGIVASTHEVSMLLLCTVMAPWIILATIQCFRAAPSRIGSVVRLILYHGAAAAYILMISGMATPLIVAWTILFLASYSYFSKIGLQLSVVALMATATIDILLHASTVEAALATIVVVASLIIVGLAAVGIGQAQEGDTLELARSKAQENLQRDRMLTIVNNLADAVLSTDSAGIIRIYNAASLNLLDTNNSLNGRHINEVVELKGEDGAIVNLLETLHSTASVAVRDDLTATIGGEVLRLEVTYSPIRSSYSDTKKSESEDGYILILRDVTKSKSLEEERDEFISVVSHELRTPITVAEGTISNVQLMMSRKDIAPNILKSAIDMAHDQVIFLSKMVNDLSTLSRAERGVADAPERISVKKLADDLFAEYSPQAEQRKLHFNLDIGGTRLGHVMASQLYLKELLQGFITNSIKYTKEGTVTLHIDRTGDILTFSIKDTGIGMSKTDQAKIFNKFYRSEDYRTRETGGTGLGLYVATKLAKKLNTIIKLESRLNHGSTFSFTLPVHDDEPVKK